jgi:hypothetical protein
MGNKLIRDQKNAKKTTNLSSLRKFRSPLSLSLSLSLSLLANSQTQQQQQPEQNLGQICKRRRRQKLKYVIEMGTYRK